MQRVGVLEFTIGGNMHFSRVTNTLRLSLTLLLGLCLAAGMTDCGGSSSISSSGTAGPELLSISISPLNPSISVGSTQQFFATGRYSDKSTKDITHNATWSSAELDRATIESAGQPQVGLATGQGAGLVTISASLGGKTGSTSLNVASNATRIPLMDMTAVENYLSFPGGLYENTSNTVPADHNTAGLARAALIQPLGPNGNPLPSGKVVFLSVGRSTAEDEFTVFVKQAGASSVVNHSTLVIVNGALTSALPCVWAVANGQPSCAPALGNQYDRVRDTVLTPLGVTEKQVQIAWIEEYEADPAGSGYQGLCDPSVGFCSNEVSHTEALLLEQQLGGILRAAKTRWPNLRQAFLSSRLYGGYSTTDHSAEPYPYEYGFAVKWLIQAQILQTRSGGVSVDATAGDLNYANGKVPWTAWGPYVWANGDTPRSDGLVWCNGQTSAPCSAENDYISDGTHPNAQGDQKVTSLLVNFFLNSPYTPWFRP